MNRHIKGEKTNGLTFTQDGAHSTDLGLMSNHVLLVTILPKGPFSSAAPRAGPDGFSVII